MNFLPIELKNIDDRLYAVAERFHIRVPDDRVNALVRRSASAVLLGVRPEHVLMGEPRPEHGTGFDGSVEVTEQLGAELLVAVRAAGVTLVASRIDAEAVLALHQPVRLSLDPRGLHFFDAESGEAIR
jgi:multiple sugar transport system ATP-binding protein